MRLIKNVLPFLLALLIVSAGFFGSGAVSRFLPDYTGQVFSGVKQEGIQNAFFSGSGSEVLVYPWNLFDRSSCLLLTEAMQQDAVSEPCFSAGKMLADFLDRAGDSPARIDRENRILVDPKSELLYLPETKISDHFSVSMALDSRYICYIHQKSLDGFGESVPVENPSEKLRSYVEEARSLLKYREFSQTEASSPEDVPMEKPNILLNYVDGMLYLYSDIGYEFSEEENVYQVMSELVQYADYTTLSREGETLIAFSQNRRGGVDSLVLYYQENLDAITGFSLQLAD